MTIHHLLLQGINRKESRNKQVYIEISCGYRIPGVAEIEKTGPLATAEIVNNLSGPAETSLLELPAEERETFEKLKGALMKRYATKDRTWVKRQRLITRRQGPNELLSDYINNIHELFSGLHVAEAEKVTYFIEGLLPSIKIEVLKKMPETLLDVEEVWIQLITSV